MTLAELRTLYRNHQLVEAVVEPSVQEGGWVVEFRHVRGGFVILTDAEGEECQYYDIDLASESAMEVGFRQVRIEDR
jgi:hypothetical protein